MSCLRAGQLTVVDRFNSLFYVSGDGQRKQSTRGRRRADERYSKMGFTAKEINLPKRT